MPELGVEPPVGDPIRFVSKDSWESRREICFSCESYVSEAEQCSECSCYVNAMSAQGHKSCPLGKWGPEYPVTDVFPWESE